MEKVTNEFISPRDIIGEENWIKAHSSCRFNPRLLSKEHSKMLFMNNSKNGFWNPDDKYVVTDNLKEITDKLFSMDNVYVAMTPCENHFSKDGEFLGEHPTTSNRGGFGEDNERIIESVKGYLDKGAAVYMYQYYAILEMIPDPNDFESCSEKPHYWWRMMVKKDL